MEILFVASGYCFCLVLGFLWCCIATGADSPELIGRQESLGGVFPPEGTAYPPFGIPFEYVHFVSFWWNYYMGSSALRENDRKFHDFLTFDNNSWNYLYRFSKPTSINVPLFPLMRHYHQHFIWQQVFMVLRYNRYVISNCLF